MLCSSVSSTDLSLEHSSSYCCSNTNKNMKSNLERPTSAKSCLRSQLRFISTASRMSKHLSLKFSCQRLTGKKKNNHSDSLYWLNPHVFSYDSLAVQRYGKTSFIQLIQTLNLRVRRLNRALKASCLYTCINVPLENYNFSMLYSLLV